MIDRKGNDVSVSELADAAFSVTAEQVLLRARRTGTNLVLWRNDEIVHVSADEYQRELENSGKSDRHEEL